MRLLLISTDTPLMNLFKQVGTNLKHNAAEANEQIRTCTQQEATQHSFYFRKLQVSALYVNAVNQFPDLMS